MRYLTILRNLLVCCATVLFISSCSDTGGKFVLKGSIKGVDRAEFYVYSDGGTFSGIDTIQVEGGDFTYERDIKSPIILTLLYPNFSQTLLIAEPGKTVRMKGDAAKLGEADISGTDENELLTQFRQQEVGKTENDARLAATEFIRSHLTTMAAVAVFKKFFAEAQSPDQATATSLINDLRKAQPRNPMVATLSERLVPALAAAPGQHLPEFSVTTLNNKSVTPQDLKGKPAIIAVWATWNGTSTPLLKALQRIASTYAGKIRIVAISLDAETEKCRQRILRDSITYDVCCDGRVFDTPTVRQLGIRYIPGCILTDASGKILARDLAPEELEQRVASLLH